MARPQPANLLKSILHNMGVVLVGFALAFLGRRIDSFLGIPSFASGYAIAAGCLLLIPGFLLRTWAAFYFYEHRMNVISLQPQQALITSGPYRVSRNPLYLGGNVFIFFGAALVLGSPAALALTAMHLPLIDLFIRREERQLAEQFGEEWVHYSSRVRRWI
jgi:protein-S-isoprenylcysteine O-methyltransferase Ste14